MKFIVSSSVLKQAVSFVMRAVKANPIVPILDNIHFSITGGVMTLKASDLQTTLLTTCPVETSDEMVFVLPALKLNQLLGSLPEQVITVTIDPDSFKHVIAWESGKTKLSSENPVDFPKAPQTKGKEETLTLDSLMITVLMDALTHTVYAVSGDDLRPAMTGVYLHAKGEEIVFVATNGHYLIKYPMSLESAVTLPSCILPSSFVRLLLKTETKDADSMTLSLTHANITVTVGNHTLIGRLIDEKYPDYENAIPTNNDKELEVNKAELAAAMKRMMLTTILDKRVRFTCESNRLTLSTENMDYDYQSDETLTVSYEDEPIVIGFSGELMLKMIDHLAGEKLKIRMSAPNRAGLMYGDDDSITSLIMPLMLISTYA